jgi:hypothetical protein
MYLNLQVIDLMLTILEMVVNEDSCTSLMLPIRLFMYLFNLPDSNLNTSHANVLNANIVRKPPPELWKLKVSFKKIEKVTFHNINTLVFFNMFTFSYTFLFMSTVFIIS